MTTESISRDRGPGSARWDPVPDCSSITDEKPNSQAVFLLSTDGRLLESLREGLPYESVEVAADTDVTQIFQKVVERVPRALILDSRLLKEGVPSICRRLRSSPIMVGLPILVIVAPENHSSRIRALESGADDCLETPVDVDALVTRLRSESTQSLPPPPLGHLHAGPINLDLDRWTVTVSGRSIRLTKKEFLLLQSLIESRGRILSRGYLLRAIWPAHTSVATRTVDVHVARLRQKLGTAGRYVVTVRNVGFRLDLVPDWLVRPTLVNRT